MERIVRQVLALLKKDILLELRNKNAISGMVLYVFSTIFICYQSFKILPDVPVWNALFWIIILFASIHAVTKSFQHETQGRQYYYYLIADPLAVIVSKILYNVLLLIFLSMLSFIIYIVVLDNYIIDYVSFFTLLMMSSIGLASLLTMISAIASKAGNAAGLTAILGFPLMIPLLITIIKASKGIADQLAFTNYSKYLFSIIGLDIVIMALALILFPYLWKD
jgi:heme exporter protein B